MDFCQNNIPLFTSLFKGREDVFAHRWELKEKSGYMPAYFYDPYLYRAHKMKGGTFQNYADKSHLPLTEDQIKKHLEGQQHIGIYPLLKDNTSWFIVADFDEENWMQDSKKFIDASVSKNIPAYLERSRSGNGGHVWIFFSEPVPAFKSRKVVLSLLVESGAISVFDKSSSFDRLFPNQDELSGKGFGNLIALPLFKPYLEQGNNCFIDPETLQPFADQWKFLSEIKKVGLSVIDQVYAQTKSLTDLEAEYPGKSNKELIVSLSSVVKLNRSAVPLVLINFLKEELNFANSEFFVKKNSGRNTFGQERYFRFITESGNNIIVPKGFIGRLLRFCKENKIEYTFNDFRKKLSPVIFSNNIELREYQLPALETSRKKDMGVIVAPPGTGKTIIGLKIIAEKQQPALIIVHRKQLMEQWMERIEAFLGISRTEIGKIGQGKTKLGKQITIGTIQSIIKELDFGEKVVILTERKEHIDTLHQYLKQSYEVISLSGEDSENSRRVKWHLLKEGSYQALITTGQFFGEGSDLQNASCLFLVYPFSFEGKLIQYIGRVQRSEIAPKIYDYRDIKIDYLNKLFLKRNTYYRKLNRQISLFDDPQEDLPDNKTGKYIRANESQIIEKVISIPIELLEFRYGGIAFNYDIDSGSKIEFEIEHDDFRPEFEVLKPYFAKALKSKVVKISIYVEIEQGKLVAQLATSEDIKKINREIIEGTRLEYTTRPIIGKRKNIETDDQNERLIQTKHPLYESGEELLENVLKGSQFKHHHNLRYLAEKHASQLMKVRFVLEPFSFILLLEGEKQFHIVLETLDTEEATYVWHFDKVISKLPDYMSVINMQLKNIRDHGRQFFLTNPPANFSRVLHDYSDEKKGFVVWKDTLEERLI